MRSLPFLATVALLGSSAANADTICEWFDFADGVQTSASQNSNFDGSKHGHARSQAALAMFEATNAIDRRYESYLHLPVGDAAASQDAAATTAVYRVLLAHYPDQKKLLDESYAVAMDEIGDEAAREGGRRIGEASAAAALKAGAIDGRTRPRPYRPRTQPGVWVATDLPIIPPYAVTWTPWFLDRAEQVRPPAPPSLRSERWAHDYDEVRRLGGKHSEGRTPHQTLMGRYRITPNMMPSLRLLADAPGRRPVENARMFALFSMVLDDTSMAVAEAKLHYNFWRPITAIRNGADDGNPATTPDPGWEPMIATPNHPEYPCAHCGTAGAIGELMKSEYGAAPPGGVRVASRSIPNAAVQVLPSWDKWVEEVNFSRTLGGVHYRFSNEAGEAMGRRIARIALTKAMRPLPADQVRPAVAR